MLPGPGHRLELLRWLWHPLRTASADPTARYRIDAFLGSAGRPAWSSVGVPVTIGSWLAFRNLQRGVSMGCLRQNVARMMARSVPSDE